tara:strand:+ start:336 stop:557 length:222 start_codon:yes stop_codon:yes gene_type:complete
MKSYKELMQEIQLTEEKGKKEFKPNEKFMFDGDEWIYSKDSKKGNGKTHFYAQKSGESKTDLKQIAYADLNDR